MGRSAPQAKGAAMPVFLFILITVVALIGVPVSAQAIYKMNPGTLRSLAILGTVVGAAVWPAIAVQFYMENASLATNYAFVLLFFFWLFSILACTPDEG